MAFNWRAFLDQYGIEYVTSGANVASGDVNVKCPMCGPADPSHHMGIGVKGEGWRCWRDRSHSGKSPIRLVQALLGCSNERARTIVGADRNIPASNSLLSLVKDELQPAPLSTTKTPKLHLPPEFMPFRDLPSARMFVKHLHRKRKYSYDQIFSMTKDWDLHYCTRGFWKGRIIFPVYMGGCLITWTGRTVYETEPMRYETLTATPERAQFLGTPLARASISDTFLWWDDIRDSDADTICLVEGPFDALRVNILGRKYGIVSTCFFTTSPSEEQVALLHELLPRFRNRFLLPDKGAESIGLKTISRLATLSVDMRILPRGVDDPGELNQTQLLNIVLD